MLLSWVIVLQLSVLQTDILRYIFLMKKASFSNSATFSFSSIAFSWVRPFQGFDNLNEFDLELDLELLLDDFSDIGSFSFFFNESCILFLKRTLFHLFNQTITLHFLDNPLSPFICKSQWPAWTYHWINLAVLSQSYHSDKNIAAYLSR